MREIDHLIPSEQGQIDEIRCHAKLCKRNLAQKPPGCTFQANRALPRARFMIQTRQNIEEMTLSPFTLIAMCASNHKVGNVIGRDISTNNTRKRECMVNMMVSPLHFFTTIIALAFF